MICIKADYFSIVMYKMHFLTWIAQLNKLFNDTPIPLDTHVQLELMRKVV